MNAARNLARCSRFIGYRGLCAAWNVSKNRLCVVKPDAVTTQISPIQSARPMSSSVKFEVMNVQDEEDFKKRVLEASCTVPVVVDFHAQWCGPCKLLGPRLESLLSKEGGKVLMAKVDIDDNPELAMEYGVRSVPTVVGMKNGKVQNQFIGVIDDDQITSFVDKLVVS